MKIKLFILGSFIVSTLAHGYRYNEGERKIGRHYSDESHIAIAANTPELKDSVTSEGEASIRFKRQHFTHNPEWHKRHGIDMPQEINTSMRNTGEHRHHFTHNPEWHARHDNHSHHHNHRHRHRHHHHPTTPISTTTPSPSCEIDVTEPTPTITPIWEIINPRGLIEGRDIDYEDTTSTSTTTITPTTRRPIERYTTSTKRTTSTTEENFREIYDVRRQDNENDTEPIIIP